MKISRTLTTLGLFLVVTYQAFFVNAEPQDLSNGPKYTIDDTIPFEWRPVQGATHLVFVEGSDVENRFQQDNNRYGVVDIGFNFKYFDEVINKVCISTDGCMFMLDHPGVYHLQGVENTKLTGVYSMIAPFWDDLYLGKGVILYQTIGEEGFREFIVTWHNIPAIGASGEKGGYFQVVMQEATGNIIFNYHSVDFGSPDVNLGNSATVGLVDRLGVSKSLYSYNEPFLKSAFSILFARQEGALERRISITHPIDGVHLQSDELSLSWNFSGVESDFRVVRLKIGSEKDTIACYQLPYCENEMILTDLPAHGTLLWIELSTSYHWSTAYCYTSTTDTGYLVSGSVQNFYGGYWAKVELYKTDTLQSTLVAKTDTDYGGYYRFSNIEPGEYDVVVKKDGYKNNALRTQHIEVINQDIIVKSPSLVRITEPTSLTALTTPNPTISWTPRSTLIYRCILTDEDGIEIANVPNLTSTYTHTGVLQTERPYYWSIIGYDSEGRIIEETRNYQFSIRDARYPAIIEPASGYSLSSNFLYLSWTPGETIVSKWKLSLSHEENATPYWEHEYDGTMTNVYFPDLPTGHPSVYVTLAYLEGDTWHQLRPSRYFLPDIDLNIHMISPEQGTVLKKHQQTFVWEVAGRDASDFSVNTIALISSNGFEFHSTKNDDWKLEQEGNKYQVTIDVLPACNEDLVFELNYSPSYNNRLLRQTYKAFDSGVLPQRDYAIESTAYNWVDATSGTRLGMKGPAQYKDIRLPFAFEFYGLNYEWIRVSEEGAATFSSGFQGSSYESISGCFPNPIAPNGLVAPFFSYFNGRCGGDIYCRTIGESPNRQYVVEWNQVTFSNFHSFTDHGSMTFQMILYESTNEIVFQYKDVYFDEEWETAANYGGEGVVGLENQDGTKACIYSHNSPMLRNEMAIKFKPF